MSKKFFFLHSLQVQDLNNFLIKNQDPMIELKIFGIEFIYILS